MSGSTTSQGFAYQRDQFQQIIDDTLAIAAAQGASCVQVSPVHAIAPLSSPQPSPYSPASRLFLNLLHVHQWSSHNTGFKFNNLQSIMKFPKINL